MSKLCTNKVKAKSKRNYVETAHKKMCRTGELVDTISEYADLHMGTTGGCLCERAAPVMYVQSQRSIVFLLSVLAIITLHCVLVCLFVCLFVY